MISKLIYLPCFVLIRIRVPPSHKISIMKPENNKTVISPIVCYVLLVVINFDKHFVLLRHFVILRSKATKNLALIWFISTQKRDSSLPEVAQNDIMVKLSE